MKYVYFLYILLTVILIPLGKKIYSDKKFVVVIDAGHGGKDSGALSGYGLMEKNINLTVALITKELIKEFDKDIEIVLTRNKDKFIELSDRADIAKAFEPDLFISLHCDASFKEKRDGLTIYLQNGKSNNSKTRMDNYQSALKFSLILNTILTEQLKIKSNGIDFANYQVLRETIDFMPCMLLEMGFITNGVESSYLEKKGQQGIAYALAKAILKYKKLNE